VVEAEAVAASEVGEDVDMEEVGEAVEAAEEEEVNDEAIVKSNGYRDADGFASFSRSTEIPTMHFFLDLGSSQFPLPRMMISEPNALAATLRLLTAGTKR